MYLCMLLLSVLCAFLQHSTLCVRTLAQPRCLCLISGYFQTLFTSTRTLSSAPLLECLCGNVNPTLGEYRLFSPPLCPRCGESNLLTETSATIKVSPISRVMLLKGFACILGRLGEHTGMSYVPSWHETQWLGVPGNPFSHVSATELNYLSQPRYLFILNKYFTKIVRIIYFWLLLLCSVSGRRWWQWFSSSLFTM